MAPGKKRRVEFSEDVTAKDLETLELLERLAAERRKQNQHKRFDKKRRALIDEFDHPALLAHHLEPGYVITPAVELVSKKLKETLETYSGRLVVAVPPQELKTSVLRWLCYWALLDDPDRRIVFASYAASLARQSGRIVRAYAEIYGSDYGLMLDQAHRDAADWQIANRIGGLFCTGVGGSLTGKPADCVSGSTCIRTADGAVTARELHMRVQSSERVLVDSYDHGRGQRVQRPVVATRQVTDRPVVTVELHNGATLTCTRDHRLHTADGYVEAAQIAVGTLVTLAEGVGRVTGVEDHAGYDTVYDFQVGGTENFYADDVLVHNCLIIDDPTRNQADADSPTVRENLMEWWSAVARTRLAPGAPVVVVQTRWAVNDLAGTLIGDGWPLVNIPAVADGVTEDALNREPGEYMESTRGRTATDWQAIEAEVGPRTWNALFMQRPVPLEGGVFKQHWFDDHRVDPGTEPWLREIVVGVDPAETGTNDEAGIIVAGLSLDGQLWILDDASGMYSQEAWGRATCLAWLRWGANRVTIERTLGMKGTLSESWRLLRRQAIAVVGYGIEGAAKVLADGGDLAAASIGQLREIAPFAEEIVDAAPDGPRELRLTPKQSKLIRAESATQPFEQGRAHMVGRFPKLEHQAVTFNASTSDSPDRVDCLALVVHHLSRGAGSSRILV